MPIPCSRVSLSETRSDLLADCETFSKYVAGAGFNPECATGEPVSALHAEMQFWSPANGHLPKRYQPNNAEHNAWKAMQQMGIVGTFTPIEQRNIFDEIRKTFPVLETAQCAQSVFDSWLCDLASKLRNKGLSKKGAMPPSVAQKPTTLASFGLVQKLVNIYLKYAFCWAVAGRYQNSAFEPFAVIPNITDFSCALHAPIDRILLTKLRNTELGRRWIDDGFLEKRQDRLKADGKWVPWSKLDCWGAYIKFQQEIRIGVGKQAQSVAHSPNSSSHTSLLSV